MKHLIVKAAAMAAAACFVAVAVPRAAADTVTFEVSGTFQSSATNTLQTGGSGSIVFTPKVATFTNIDVVPNPLAGFELGTFTWDLPNGGTQSVTDVFTLKITQIDPTGGDDDVNASVTGTLTAIHPVQGGGGLNVTINFGGAFALIPDSDDETLVKVKYTPNNVSLLGTTEAGNALLSGSIQTYPATSEGEDPAAVPLPASAWMGSILFGTVAGVRFLRRRRQAA